MLIDPFNVDLNLMDRHKTKQTNFNQYLDEIIDEIIEKKLDILNAYQENRVSEKLVRAEVEKIVHEKTLNINNLEEFIDETMNHLFGYGPLQPYIDDLDITDIFGNKKDVFFIKKFGKTIRIPVKFDTEQDFLKFLYKIVAICGGKLDENENAEAVLTDRKRLMRIVITLKPIGATSPMISIRKHSRTYTPEELVRNGMLTPEQCNYLKQAVLDHKTIVFVGKGGSGKTTLMGALMELMPPYERAVFIQETCEILPRHKNILTKLVRISSNPLVKDYTLFDLTKIGLLESLDRIFIAELKDKEAFDFFNAIYTGHTGSMTTLHTPVDKFDAEVVYNRLLQLMARANMNIPHEELKKMLIETLDLIVFMKDFKVINILDTKEGIV